MITHTIHPTVTPLFQSMRKKMVSGICLLLSLFVLFGCNSEGDSLVSSNTTEDGQVVVALTDAEGDFSSYTVDVISVTLTHANGTVVETLPLNTRVDFAQYTELAEFLTAANVPNGRYVKASMTLDYGDSDIWVEDADGSAQQVSGIVDANGDPVTTLVVDVVLEGQRALPVAPGLPKNLLLDFDLEASNSLAFEGENIIMTVSPVLLAEVDPRVPRPHRLRGLLQSVDLDASSFELRIRPFFHKFKRDTHHLGTLTALTDDDTVFEIDGIAYQGNDGLLVLDSMDQDTPVIAIGDLRFNPLRFMAREVYAGTSCPGGELDVVRGTVKRTDDTIIVKGATLFRASGAIVFNDLVTVQLDDSTTVTKQLSIETFGIEAISVGQRITVHGIVTDDSVSDLQFSATNGFARMHLSTLRGDVIALPDETTFFTLTLTSINGRGVSVYEFSGTGIDSQNDADPVSYEIETGVLTLTGIEETNHVGVLGFPTGFGSAPADFTAKTIAIKVKKRNSMEQAEMRSREQVGHVANTPGIVPM